jgi:exoribonuclease R
MGLPDTLSDDMKRTIKAWNNVNGQYVLYNEDMDCSHELMNLKSYVHITSPIRRLVDLLNQISMMVHTGMIKKISHEAQLFVDEWNKDIDYINATMRSIRKVQNNCELMHKCFNDDAIMNLEHTGVVFDKIEKEGGIYTYMVYLEKLKLMTKIRTMENLENYSIRTFKLYLFEHENKVVKKIRVALL